MSASGTIQGVRDTELGLDDAQIQTLRRTQMEVGGSSSRAASRASSQGLLLLDSSSLASLSRHFDALMARIGERMDSLIEQSQMAAIQQYDRAGNLIDMADAEIARLNAIDGQIEELETEMDRIAQIKEIVRQYRQRVEETEQRLESSGSHRDGHRHRHRHGDGHGESSRRHRR
jgi:hypothetical protein